MGNSLSPAFPHKVGPFSFVQKNQPCRLADSPGASYY